LQRGLRRGEGRGNKGFSAGGRCAHGGTQKTLTARRGAPENNTIGLLDQAPMTETNRGSKNRHIEGLFVGSRKTGAASIRAFKGREWG